MTARPAPRSAPYVGRLPGNRLHLAEGPIDLVIAAWGPKPAVEAAYRAAAARFAGLLSSLVAVLPRLKAPIDHGRDLPPTAARMFAAVAPYTDRFVTPMAAVAGAVADTILEAIAAVPGIERAYVNNRGDIAVHLAPGERLAIGVVSDLRRPQLAASIELGFEDGIRGIATSGWDGRSFSLGIADAVTVLAADAAAADAAATLIANEVDADHPAIRRRPAVALDPDSDLGERLVTVAVGPLPDPVIEAALERGAAYANELRRRGWIRGAMLVLKDRVRFVGETRGVALCSSCARSS